MTNFMQKMANRAYRDEYLKNLIYKAEKDYANSYVSIYKNSLIEKDKDHLLRFADILCRSTKPNHRNLSLKIISLIMELESSNITKYEELSIVNVLVKLGNFPTLNTIESAKDFINIDTEIAYDYILKNVYQESPLGGTFTDSQKEVYDLLKKSNHYSFSASTSFGKSYLFEAYTKYIIDSHNNSDNIAFIVPTKALINQVSNKLRKLFIRSKYKVVVSPKIPKIFLRDEQHFIFVFTPERLITYFNEKNNPKIDYLFLDEAHKLLKKNDSRTPLLYHALVMAKRKSVNIFFASPRIKNPGIFLELIQNSSEESIIVEEAPVSQNRFFIDCDKNKIIMLSDFGDDINIDGINFDHEMNKRLKKILDTFSRNSQSIVYCNTVDKTILTAIELSTLLSNVEDDEIEDLISYIRDKVHNQYFLIKCLKKGIAYHFGGIPEEIKFKAEELYKKGKIKHMFCTSTLLEGVNLPAKNIFILSEKIGRKNMDKVDFWNLAGRAGRLSKDISGNIFCVNLYNQKGYWKSGNVDVLRDTRFEDTKPQIMENRNANLFTNISRHFNNEEYTRANVTVEEDKIIKMYGNILIYHDIVGSDSVLKNMFINENKYGIDTLAKIKKQNKVPPEILSDSIDISYRMQNEILSSTNEPMPDSTNFEDCRKLLEILYDAYKWNVTESKGKSGFANSKRQLIYYSILLDSWVNAKSLKILIQNTINYYHHGGECRTISYYKDGQKYKEKFNKNDDYHINTLINNSIKDIENIIKFKVKRYVTNYQSLLKNENIHTIDWSKYLDYGTTNTSIIQIQELGFPRHLAIFLFNHYINIFIKDGDDIIDIDKEVLYKSIDRKKYSEEFKEIEFILHN